MLHERVSIVGNAGGGKSRLARRVAKSRALPLVEVDKLLWRADWVELSDEEFEAEHAPLIDAERWLIEGLGKLSSIQPRLLRSTWVIFVDMPLWQHFWLAAERQISCAKGELDHPPAGIKEMVTTKAMFETLWEVEQDWMPRIRTGVDEVEASGIEVTRLRSVAEIDAFTAALLGP